MITFSIYLAIEDPVIARPFTEPKRSLGTELLVRIAVELKPQPTHNFKGSIMPISNGHRMVDLKKKKKNERIKRLVMPAAI